MASVALGRAKRANLPDRQSDERLLSMLAMRREGATMGEIAAAHGLAGKSSVPVLLRRVRDADVAVADPNATAGQIAAWYP